MKSRFSLLGAAGLAALFYVLGTDEGREPGSTDAKVQEVRDLGVTLGGHTAGGIQDLRAVSGPLIGDLGATVAGVGATEPDIGVDESLLNPDGAGQ